MAEASGDGSPGAEAETKAEEEGREVMDWQKWTPTRKVTAASMAAAVAFLFVWLLDSWHEMTGAEAVALGSAFAVVIAYLVPERDGNGNDS